MKLNHVEGNVVGKVILYALSTCVWCKKTKKFLSDLGIDYQYVFVDLLEGDERESAVNEVARHNPDCSFPSIVIDDKECVVGFRPEELKKRLVK